MSQFDHDHGNSQEKNYRSRFSCGGFVLGLIVVVLLVLLITWSVSFTAMLFGAIGSLLSLVTPHIIDLKNHRFAEKKICGCHLCDETFAYLVVRAGFGMIFGTATFIIAFSGVVSATNWASIAVIALFGGFLFDRILFRT